MDERPQDGRVWVFIIFVFLSTIWFCGGKRKKKGLVVPCDTTSKKYVVACGWIACICLEGLWQAIWVLFWGGFSSRGEWGFVLGGGPENAVGRSHRLRSPPEGLSHLFGVREGAYSAPLLRPGVGFSARVPAL